MIRLYHHHPRELSDAYFLVRLCGGSQVVTEQRFSGLTSLRSDVGNDLVGRPRSQSPVERKAHIPISNPSSNLFDAPANINPPTIPIFPYQPPYPISSSPLPYLRFLKAIIIIVVRQLCTYYIDSYLYAPRPVRRLIKRGDHLRGEGD